MNHVLRSSWRWPLLGLLLIAAAAVAWSLRDSGATRPASAPPLAAPTVAGDWPAGYDLGSPRQPAPTGETHEYDLTVKEAAWEIAPGVRVQALTFNGQVPGPTLHITAGNTLRVRVKNMSGEATAIHWHGLPVPNAMDGVPPFTQNEIAPGQTFTYEFPVGHAGTYMYHSHLNAVSQIDRGLYGTLIVDPASPPATTVDKDFTMLLSAWDTTGMGEMTMPGMGQGSGMAGMMNMNYNYFTINGKAFPANEVWSVNKGDLVRVRILNISNLVHPMHLHGHNFTVVAKDGEPIRPDLQQTMNTLAVNAGETYDIVFRADNPGVWVFHCHELHHTENAGVEPGGLMQVIQYAGFALPTAAPAASPSPSAVRPAAIAPAGLPAGAVWVANEQGDSLSVLDAASARVVATLKGIPGPHNVQVAPDGQSVWAVSGHANLAVQVDAATYQVRGTVPTGHHPAHIILLPDGKTAYVTNSEDNTVSVIDTAARQVVATIPVGAYPHGLRPSPDGRWVAVANMQGTTVSLINTATRQKVADIEVGAGPAQVAFAPDGQTLYVSLNTENAVAKVDVAARTLAGKIAVGQGPVQVSVTPDGRRLLVANQGSADHPGTTVAVIATAGFTVEKTIPTGQGAHGVVIAPGGTHAYVTNLYGNDVAVLDLERGVVVARVAVGSTPNGISFAAQAPAPPPQAEMTLSLPGGSDDHGTPGGSDDHGMPGMMGTPGMPGMMGTPGMPDMMGTPGMPDMMGTPTADPHHP